MFFQYFRHIQHNCTSNDSLRNDSCNDSSVFVKKIKNGFRDYLSELRNVVFGKIEPIEVMIKMILRLKP